MEGELCRFQHLERRGRRGSGMFFDALEGGASSQAVEGDGCCKTGESVDKEYVM